MSGWTHDKVGAAQHPLLNLMHILVSSHHLPLMPGLVLCGDMERLGVTTRDPPIDDCLLFFVSTTSDVRVKGGSFEGEEWTGRFLGAVARMEES